MTDSLMNLGKVASLLDGELCNADPKTTVSSINTLVAADESQATFLANMSYKHDLAATNAGIVLIAKDLAEDYYQDKPVLRVADPYLAFAKLQRVFHPQQKSSGVRHASAVIDANAIVAADVDIGANVVIAEGVRIASGCMIAPGCIIDRDVQIGENCVLHAAVIITHDCVLGDRVVVQSGTVIGSDGFGYVWSGSQHLKIPQVGRVVLGNDVEIGANTCIDRGAIGDTILHDDVKLDNLIQVAHNVVFDEHCIIAGQAGFAGSTKMGKGCQVGAQAGVSGHLNIGDGCKIGAKSGVIGHLEAGGTYAGFPAMPHRLWLRATALFAKLPERLKKLNTL